MTTILFLNTNITQLLNQYNEWKGNLALNQDKLKAFKRHVNSYLSGKLIVKTGFSALNIENGIDWNYKHYKNSNTYQTYLHSLNFIHPLLEIATIDKNQKLFHEINRIINDWSNHNLDIKQENYAWSEHPTSYRIDNIINFQEADHKYKINKRLFNKFIKLHCEYLYDEKNYKMNNHGLMMDNALLRASTYIKNEKMKMIYQEKAIYRVRLSIYRDFTRRGVHLENSPEYQRVVLIIYNRIINTLKTNQIKIDNSFLELFRKATDFKSVIIKPNKEYPMIGDTGLIKEKNINKKYNDFVDYDAGLAILQNRNKYNDYKSTHLTFNCGYQSKTHKHLDDLSLTYYVDGHDILIDPGKYSYDKNDKVRKYLVSPEAHSTVCQKNKSYSLSNPFKDSEHLRIVKNYYNKKYKLISGINKLSDKVKITRTIILTPHPALIVLDRITCKEQESMQQIFNINEHAKIKKNIGLEYELDINNEKYRIKSHKYGNSEIKSKVKKGYVSHEFSKYNENNRIVFEQIGKSLTFLTSIDNVNKPISNLTFKNNTLQFEIEKEKISIEI